MKDNTSNKDNVCESEIENFNNLASSWWEPTGHFKALHAINIPRIEFIQKHINVNGKDVLDIGCGGGILSESLAKLGANVTAIDMASEPLEIAINHAKEQDLKIDYIQTSAEEVAADKPNSFDIITCMELLEHVPDPESIVNACSKLIKDDGVIFFSTINRNIKSLLFGIFGAEYLLKLVPKGTHDYEKFLKPSEIDRFGRKNNLSTQEVSGIKYCVLTNKAKLTSDTKINYICVLKKSVHLA